MTNIYVHGAPSVLQSVWPITGYVRQIYFMIQVKSAEEVGNLFDLMLQTQRGLNAHSDCSYSEHLI